MSDLTLVYTLFGSREDAERIARMMVEGGLAACANLLSPSQSVYRWNGALEQQQEYPVLFKTAAAQRESLIAALGQAHDYDLPAIIDWPAHAMPDYVRWVADMTGGS